MQIRVDSIRAAAMALALSLAASPAAAQTEAEAEFQSYRIPGWSFTPAVGMGLVYDSNVALSGRDVSGETQGDALFGITPSGQLEYFGRRTEFAAGYRGFLRRYMDVEGLDTFGQRLNVGFQRAVSKRVSVFARDNFGEWPTTDEVEVNGVPFRRVGSRTNTFAAGADLRLSKFTSLTTRYDMTWVDFDREDEPLALTGGWIHGIQGSLTRQMTERLALGGEYTYRRATQDDGEREFSFQDVGAIARFAIGPHTTGSAGAGFAMLHDRTTSDTRTGPFVRLGITHQLEHATFGGSFQRQFVPSFGFGGASSSQDLRGFIRMPIAGPRVYVQGAGSWRRTNPFRGESLELDTIRLTSTIGFAAARWARLEGVYTYTRQDSIITGGEIDRHRIGAQVVVAQPMRID